MSDVPPLRAHGPVYQWADSVLSDLSPYDTDAYVREFRGEPICPVCRLSLRNRQRHVYNWGAETQIRVHVECRADIIEECGGVDQMQALANKIEGLDTWRDIALLSVLQSSDFHLEMACTHGLKALAVWLGAINVGYEPPVALLNYARVLREKDVTIGELKDE